MVDYQHKGLPRFACEAKPLQGMQQSAMFEKMERHPTEKMGLKAFENEERRHL